MKFTKKKDYDGSIRKVWNNDKTKCFGIVGTVGDLLIEKILTECNAFNITWCYLDRTGNAIFGNTREDVTMNLK